MLNNKFLKKISLISLAILFFSSCANDVSDSVSLQVRDDFREASEAMERAKKPTATTVNDTVSASEGIWLGDSSTTRPHREPLPKKLETDMGITLITDEALSINDIANKIHELTGIPIYIDDLVDKKDLEDVMVSHSGKLSNLLTKIGTKMNLRWYYENGSIVFYQQQTKTFTLYALATETKYSSTIKSDQDKSSSVENSAELNEWDEIEDALKNMIDKGKFSISPATGTITVTASPATLRRVGEYITSQNRRLSKQVAITVNVLQVSLNDSDSFGIDLNMAFKSAATGLGLGVDSIGDESPSNALNFKILDGKSSFAQFNGTEAAVKALSEQGKVSLLTSSVVTVRNNKIAPINNTRTFSYIKEFSTSGDDSDKTTDVKPEEESIGFNMLLQPSILENGRVLLMFNMSLRELVDIEKETFGEYQIQLPIIENRNFSQEIIMESGQTLIMTGFEKIENRDTRQGIGNPGFSIFGGGKTTKSKRDVLVVIVTPQVLVSPLEPEARRPNVWGTPSF